MISTKNKIYIALGAVLVVFLAVFFYRGALVNKERKIYIAQMNSVCTAVKKSELPAEKIWNGQGSSSDMEQLVSLQKEVDKGIQALAEPQPGMVVWYDTAKELYGYYTTVCELDNTPAETHAAQADAFNTADTSMKAVLQKLEEYLASIAESKDAESVITTGVITDKDY